MWHTVMSEFEIVPETEGSELNMREAYNALSEAVSDNESSCRL